MEENKKKPSPIAWVLGQTGDHGGQYVISVLLAVIGVAFSVAPYFVVAGIVQRLMEGNRDFAFYLSRCLIMAVFWLGRVLEYQMVPMMTSSIRIGEELSAAALTRGLGGPGKRTNICRIGLRLQDYVLLAGCLFVVLVWILEMIGVKLW